MAQEKLKTRTSNDTKLDHLTERVDEIYKIIVVGDPENNKPGLVERVRNAENYIETQRRIIWGLGLAVGADVVTRLWQLVTR